MAFMGGLGKAMGGGMGMSRGGQKQDRSMADMLRAQMEPGKFGLDGAPPAPPPQDPMMGGGEAMGVVGGMGPGMGAGAGQMMGGMGAGMGGQVAAGQGGAPASPDRANMLKLIMQRMMQARGGGQGQGGGRSKAGGMFGMPF